MGDIDDVLSVAGDDVAMDQMSCYEDVRLVVKHTFVEFHLEEVDVPKLKRSQSEPSLFAPTTCASANGDDGKSSSLPSVHGVTNWADITELELSSVDTSANAPSRSDEH